MPPFALEASLSRTRRQPASLTPAYDNTLDTGARRKGQNGNLTADGIFKFVYDTWNP